MMRRDALRMHSLSRMMTAVSLVLSCDYQGRIGKAYCRSPKSLRRQVVRWSAEVTIQTLTMMMMMVVVAATATASASEMGMVDVTLDKDVDVTATATA